MEVTPIDLRSNHPNIYEQDFLQMDLETNSRKWDAISLSLVVNFVPEPKDRGVSCSLFEDQLVLNPMSVL
jgi:25S rRNA (adenine2142-N1)-methyltransferase